MPITVVCSSCKARFTVSDKFAGKQGPCPKCKAVITIPKVEEQAQVTIHAPDEAGPGKTATGQASIKPIARKQTRLQPVPTAIGICGAVGVLAIAWVAGELFRVPPDGTGAAWHLALRVIGLLLVSVPVAVAGYVILREEEIEPHRGLWLWVRGAICAAAFVALWSAYYFIPVDLRSTAWSWFFIAPIFFAIGAAVAFGCFDLEYTNALVLYAFYVLATLALGWLAHLELPWSVVTSR